jgi:hypothetical protein
MPAFRSTHRAPVQSGARLIDPRIEAIEPLVDNNRLLRAAFDTRIGDLRLWEVITAARREVLTVAAEYTSSYREVERPERVADWIARPVVMGGHQPDLFHPGVWLKNFVLDRYARAVGGTALNLVVDTDRCGPPEVGVPVGDAKEASLVRVAFDARGPSALADAAWEERPIVDEACFHSFAERCGERLAAIVPEPILRRWWPIVRERAAESHRLGLAIAQARHALEGRLGTATLELPVSEMVKLPTMMVLTGWLLSRFRELHDAINAALADYRVTRRIRGRGRPMPDLACLPGDENGGWHEVPWWMWSRDRPARRRVYASLSPSGTLTLSDLRTTRVELPISPQTGPSRWVDALSRLQEHDVRLRPRAILTTLMARLLVADVFVHGIGGAAYDCITDEVIRRLTGCDPPRYAVVSGTLRLPRPADDRTSLPAAEEHAEVRRLLRDLRYHPERHLMPIESQPRDLQDLVAHKRQWIDTFPTAALARRRRNEIGSANERLAAALEPEAARLRGLLEPLERRMRAEKILDNREFPWCFFPERTLRDFLLLESE